MAPVEFTIGKKTYTVHHGRGARKVQGFFLAETERGGAFLVGCGNTVRANADVDTVVDIHGRQVPLKIRLVKE